MKWLLTCQDELEKLNEIVWPAIRLLAQKQITDAANNGKMLRFCSYNLIISYRYVQHH